MELFIVGLSIVGLATSIAAIDESIDWMASFRRVGEEDLQFHTQHPDTYDRLSDQGYRE